MTKEELLKMAKPALFNTEMVRATLDGSKTEIRQVIEGRIKLAEDRVIYYPYKPIIIAGKEYESVSFSGGLKHFIREKCSYKPGDYLFVRETWGIGNLFYDDEDVPNLCVCYKASEDRIDETCTIFRITDEEYEKYENRMIANMQDWFPSIHMPKEAARIFLRVTEVKAERLHDITGSECVKEGIPKSSLLEVGNEFTIGQFHDLWDSTIKPKDRDKYGWDANPWVWVIEFERIEPDE